jgi:multidrug efflux pump subunit AcrA (membrane-fusion protein)
METVEVRARVSGFLDSIHFKDGQIAKTREIAAAALGASTASSGTQFAISYLK